MLILEWMAGGEIIRQSARAYTHMRVISVGQRCSNELLELQMRIFDRTENLFLQDQTTELQLYNVVNGTNYVLIILT